MKFSFPLLDDDEILSCLKELQIPFLEESLKKPTQETIEPMYEEFICFFYNITRKKY